MDIIQQLKEDLEKMKEQFEVKEKCKSETMLAKLEADDLKQEAEQRVGQLLEELSEIDVTLSKKQSLYNREIQDLEKEKEKLMSNIEKLDCKMKECTDTLEMARSELQVDNVLPYKNINYKKVEFGPGNLSNISYTCQILIQRPYVLQGGQALLTFEKEEVAQGIIDKRRHNVELDNGFEDVRAYNVELGRTVTFEVNMTISHRKIIVGNLPTDLPEEMLKDKLELTFYKSNIGGGEVESVEHNWNNNSACITYKEDGVAQRVLKTTQHQLTAGDSTYEISISPVIKEQLNKLQIFSDVCQKTVLLSGIKNQEGSEDDDIKDLIEIHFQKPSNGGDEVECIAFSLKDKLAYFEQDMS